MLFLKHYIEFASRLTLVTKYVNNFKDESEYVLELPHEIIMMIFHEFYKVLVAKEVIYNKLRWSINCEICLCFNWSFNLIKLNTNFTSYPNMTYNKLMVCKNGCNYKLKCGHIIHIHIKSYDIKTMNLKCKFCDHTEKKYKSLFGKHWDEYY